MSQNIIEDLFSKRVRNSLSNIKSRRQDLSSGLNRILEAYDKSSFIIKQNYMRNVFYKNQKLLYEEINGGVNELLAFIVRNPNKNAKQLSEDLNTPLRTIERYIKQLKEEDKIEFKGAPRTGGYFAK